MSEFLAERKRLMKKTKYIFCLLCFLLFGYVFSFAQNPYTHIEGDSTVEKANFDTVKINNASAPAIKLDSTKTAELHAHSPRKATLYSTILPGLGQAYNKKYWKIPIVYGGFGAMAYFFTSNNAKYNKFKKALILRSDGDETTVDAYATQYPNQQSLIDYKDYYRRNRDLSVIGFALFYILNIVDANVDANLYYFDVSDDLSLQWNPAVIPGATFASGISLRLKF